MANTKAHYSCLQPSADEYFSLPSTRVFSVFHKMVLSFSHFKCSTLIARPSSCERSCHCVVSTEWSDFIPFYSQSLSNPSMNRPQLLLGHPNHFYDFAISNLSFCNYRGTCHSSHLPYLIGVLKDVTHPKYRPWLLCHYISARKHEGVDSGPRTSPSPS